MHFVPKGTSKASDTSSVVRQRRSAAEDELPTGSRWTPIIKTTRGKDAASKKMVPQQRGDSRNEL